MHYRSIGFLIEKINLLREKHTEIEENIKDIPIVQLQECQKEAIAMGEHVEKLENIDETIIALLENYCESIYVLSVDKSSDSVKKLNVLLDELEQHIIGLPIKYRVVFLPYKVEMWDSLESIWKAFCKDDRFLCDVVPIPYFEANAREGKWEMRYDGNLFPSDVPIVNYSEYKLEEKKPDFAFIHNPFDKYNYVTSVYMDYYSWELKKNVFKLIYVPYYINSGRITETYKSLPSFQIIDYFIFQSDEAKESCANEKYYDRILPLGSPKVDKLVELCKTKVSMPEEWGNIDKSKKLLLLNTTINDLLHHEKKLFIKLMHCFDMLKKDERVQLIWRPHPLLEATIKSTRPELTDDFRDLMDYFLNNKIGVLDKTEDVSRVVACTDAYIGSAYSSIIILYTIAEKPVFLFDNDILSDECSNPKKNNTIKQLFKKNSHFDYYSFREWDGCTLNDFIQLVVSDDLADIRALQREEARRINAYTDGTCGQRIHDALVELLEKALWGED